MNKNEICIATISWARNEEEEKELRTSLETLSSLNIPVYITDGGSSEDFVHFIKDLPGFTVFSAKGLWPQVRSSLTEAAKSGTRMILYTEPDKLDFFAMHLAKMIEAVSVNETTGVVLASRSANGFTTFPLFQQMTEITINNCCKEAIGKETDYCYGPFLFSTQLVLQLRALPENIGWGWRPFLFAVVHRLNLSIDAYTANFVCPMTQQNDDAKERLYRMKQLTQNVEGLLLATSTELP